MPARSIFRRPFWLALVTAFSLAACGGGGSTPAAPTYTIGGTVSGLPGGTNVVVYDNGGDSLTLTGNGSFTFATPLINGAAYLVTAPGAPAGSTCTVSAGSGTVSSANVTNVMVACHATVASYTVGGSVTGLPSGASMVIQDNDGDNLTLTGNGPFTFATPLANGAAYSATVFTQPAGETCGITAASGSVASANVTTLSVACASTATTGSTAISALSVGNARIALVPLNLGVNSNGVLPAPIDGTTTLTGTFVSTTFPITSCSTDSANLLAVCMNYNSSTVALLDLSKFAATFNVADIKETEFDTGASGTFGTTGANCTLCGVVAIPALKSFVVSASDGYRVYAYPAASATSPLTPAKIYAVPITENFALSPKNNWVIAPEYYSNSGARALRIIDLVGGLTYTWTNHTDDCSAELTNTPCVDFSTSEVDSVAYSDDTGLITMMDESGQQQLTVDMSQAVFNAVTGTFTAPHSYNSLPVVGPEMSGILASSIGHWGYIVAEFSDAWVGVEQLPTAGGASGSIAITDPAAVYLDLTTLTSAAPCSAPPSGGSDPHAQGYTVNNAGVPLGLYVSGDSKCVVVIDFAKLYGAPRQAAPTQYLVDTTTFDPVATGTVKFFAIPSE